ncbi:unnamed protein product [Mytilus coruscus]|uniref:Peptidase A2 domain-containing protein n=1 Tax=Mytilus coruscus TaxID=42192 RepID=A0A6J8BWY1_MYTCO|nr:unnamed protein product [Mytilus coruscus]
MNNRFGFQELPETSQVQFQTSAQGEKKTLEELSERVLSLATRAYSRYSEQLMTEQAIMRFCQGCNDTVAGTKSCISKPKTMDSALDMIRWCQHTRKAVCAIQKSGKMTNESLSEKPANSPVVLGAGSSKSSMDNRLSRIEEYMEKIISTVTTRSLYQRLPDLQDTSNRQSVLKEPTSQQVSFNENSKDDFYESEGVVSAISTVRSLGAAKLLRVEVNIAGKKVLALVDSGSEVTILKDTIFDTLEPKPYAIRETTMHGAGTNMTMPCRLTSPSKFKIGDLHFNQHLYVAPVSCDMILGCDFIIQNKVMNIGELIISVQNRNMPLILGDESTAHEPNVNVVHGPNTSDSSSDEKLSTEGSTQRFPATQLSRQSADIHFETVIPQIEFNLGMMASTSTQESDERGIQEEPDQCRDNTDQCCTNKVESSESLEFYTCPKSGKGEKTCVKSRTDHKCPVKNCPVVVDRRDLKRHCFEEHLSEIFQTYHSTRLMKDSRFHRHRA